VVRRLTSKANPASLFEVFSPSGGSIFDSRPRIRGSPVGEPGKPNCGPFDFLRTSGPHRRSIAQKPSSLASGKSWSSHRAAFSAEHVRTLFKPVQPLLFPPKASFLRPTTAYCKKRRSEMVDSTQGTSRLYPATQSRRPSAALSKPSRSRPISHAPSKIPLHPCEMGVRLAAVARTLRKSMSDGRNGAWRKRPHPCPAT